MSGPEACSIALENGMDGRILWSGTQEPEQPLVGEGEGCTELPAAVQRRLHGRLVETRFRPKGARLLPAWSEGSCEKIGPGERLAVPLTRGPSPPSKGEGGPPDGGPLKFGHFEEQFSWVNPHPACGHPLPKGEGEIHALER
jgi:hypothetical protein